MLILHKQVWESWLTIWLMILSVLFILSKSNKEKIFIFLNFLVLGSPTLFYFWNLHQNSLWRFFVIGEKAIPQLLIYTYILYKSFYHINKENLRKTD